MAMKDESPDHHSLDELVRAYLEQQAEREDTTALKARVFASISRHDSVNDALDEEPITAARGRRKLGRLWKPAAYVAATAAAVMIAFVLGRMENQAHASASALVEAAISTHGEAIERGYVVTVEHSGQDPLELEPPLDVRLWTQGHRFWVEVDHGERRWAWGRTADGAVWTTLGPRRAVEIEPSELGRPLQYMADLYSLELESLLKTILRHCQLERTSSTTTTHIINARSQARRVRWIREAVIEVDKETKAVRRLVLHRQLPKHAPSTFTCTLVESRTPDESKYGPRGHLQRSFQVFTRDSQREQRRAALIAWFGKQAERWIKEPTESE